MNLLDFAYLPIVAATAPIWARKSRSDWSGRMGKTPPLLPMQPMVGGARGDRSKFKRILLHAVSVGEVNTLRGLVPLLRERADVVVSVGTDTGIKRARELFSDPSKPEAFLGVDRVVRYPLDFSGAVKRFLDAVKPDAVGLVELELWPNFVNECARRSIPVSVINGRLSARSFKGYRRLRWFFGSVFEKLEFAAVQDEAYAQRFVEMGVSQERVKITGSMKWDSVRIRGAGEEVEGARELGEMMGVDQSKVLVVGGSTGPLGGSVSPTDYALFVKRGSTFVVNGRERLSKDAGEEHLLDVCVPRDVQLMCAPRKPERFDDAFVQMGGANRCVRYSACGAGKRPRGGCDRFLLDTIGKLRAAYGLATVAVVGRSFGVLHGSDPIESIALGVPTVIGPAYADFSSIVEAFGRADAIEIAEIHELPEVIERLVQDESRRKRMIENGYACIKAHQGATRRHAEMLWALVGAGDQAKTMQ